MPLPINYTDGFVSITAVGGETDLDFDFPIYEKSHLRIIRTRSGTDTDLVLNTDYTIADGELEQAAGGTAVLAGAASPAVAADVYTLLLNVPEERTTDFSDAGDFKAETLNRELDLATQQIQQLRRDVDKAASLPDTSTLTSLELPTPEANKVLAWNATEDGLENTVNLAAISLGAGVEDFLITPSSANLRTAITDETGSGSLVFATSPTLVTPALGTPSSVTLTNATGLPISTGVSGLGTGVATFLATPSSANLASAVTGETGSGALVFGTSPTISGATLSGTTNLTGGQIAFPATQSASSDANTLDDYEEGTFTPDVFFGGANVGLTYTTRTGRYTKVGNRVDLEILITLSAKGSSTGVVTITASPFTAAIQSAGFLVINTNGASWPNNSYLVLSSTTFRPRANSTTGITELTDANFTDTSSFYATLTFFV